MFCRVFNVYRQNDRVTYNDKKNMFCRVFYVYRQNDRKTMIDGMNILNRNIKAYKIRRQTVQENV